MYYSTFQIYSVQLTLSVKVSLVVKDTMGKRKMSEKVIHIIKEFGIQSVLGWNTVKCYMLQGV